MPYLVKAPKDPRLEKALQFRLKKIGEGDNYILYQGVDTVVIPLEVSWPEALELFKKIKVEGGYKRLPKTAYINGRDEPLQEPTLVICPKRDRILTVRLSDDEYELLKEDAYSESRAVSSWARQLVMNLVWEYLEREKYKKAMRKVKKEEC
ncbi:MAG: hypothetical protein ACTSXC_07090 [Candidatus Freyarchaeota archaeon]